jgi:site-specific recombinase XerC
MTERRYLKNVTPKTLTWYQQSFKTFDATLESETAIKQRIVELRSRGVSASSVNSWLRCINAYLKWKGAGIKIPRLKEEQKILATLNPEQVKRIAEFKPRETNQTRTHAATLLMLDCGLRISEVLGLQFENCDFDNLVVKVRAKGNKHA